MSNNNSRHHGGAQPAHAYFQNTVSDGATLRVSSNEASCNGLHNEYINDHFACRALPRSRFFEESLTSSDFRLSWKTAGALTPVHLSRTDSVQGLVRCGIFRVASEGRDIGLAASSPSWLPADRPTSGPGLDVGDIAVVSDRAFRDVLKNPVKRIEIRYQDHSGDLRCRTGAPDFRIKNDGAVEVLKDPDRHTRDTLTIEVERSVGEKGSPSVMQQLSTDRLVEYLSGRFMTDTTRLDGTPGKCGHILDPQGLLSGRMKARLGCGPEPEDSLPPEAREQVHRTNRWHGSGGGVHGGDGRFSPDAAADQFPRRDVKREPNEDDKLAALKDLSSSYISRGEKNPYVSVHRREGRGHCVGRYGISADQFMDWLSGLSDEEIERLIKSGKLPKVALDLKRGKKTPDGARFQAFLDKMKSGEGDISKGDIKEFFPKQLQERIGSDVVKKYALDTADLDSNGHPVGVNIGKTALSMVLGHSATNEESARPEFQSLIRSAGQAYPLALERAMDGSREIDLSDAAKKIVSIAQSDVGERLWTKHGAAVQWGNLGCAASVSHVLRDAGVSNLDELSVAGLSSKLQRQGWKRESFSERRPGDVIIALGPRHGHTGVIGAHRDETYNNHSSNGRWSNDRAGYWLSGKWPTVYVLRAPAQL